MWGLTAAMFQGKQWNRDIMERETGLAEWHLRVPLFVWRNEEFVVAFMDSVYRPVSSFFPLDAIL